MNPSVRIIFIIIFAVFLSCSSLVEPDTSNNQVDVFDQLWNQYDIYYSFFEHKGIDWDAVYSEFRPLITNNTTDRELFDIFSLMLSVLKDGHASLDSKFDFYIYEDYWKNEPRNYFPGIIEKKYLGKNTEKRDGIFTFGGVNEDIGYIHIATFSGIKNQFSNFSDIIDIMNNFDSIKGLIIDVRDNGGGSEGNSAIIASHFADQKRLYSWIRWKNGPGHSDFSEAEAKYIEPAKSTFLKPVVLLTNKKCFSACESFVLAMREFPHVTVIGSTTGGGSGSPILRELQNGWVYRISRWIQMTTDHFIYEGVGLSPEISIDISEADHDNQIDSILEKAIQLILK